MPIRHSENAALELTGKLQTTASAQCVKCPFEPRERPDFFERECVWLMVTIHELTQSSELRSISALLRWLQRVIVHIVQRSAVTVVCLCLQHSRLHSTHQHT